MSQQKLLVIKLGVLVHAVIKNYYNILHSTATIQMNISKSYN